MTEIAPFKAIRYDLNAVGNLAQVVAPPYDVISEAGRDALEALSPYNVVRLVLGRDEPGDDATLNKYTRARALLEAWTAAGVLRVDDDDSITLYEMRSSVAGRPHVTRGILAAVKLDPPESGGVLPHERTYDTIVEDRLQLLRATATNLDMIFCVYDGQDGEAREAIDALAATPPLAQFTTAEDGIEHVIWRLSDPRAVDAVVRALEKPHVVIADGHHRCRTAQHYRDERRRSHGSGPWDSQLMFLVDAARFGPALLPIHRVVDDVDADMVLDRLGEVFVIEQAPAGNPEALAAALGARRAQGARVFAMFDATRAWWLTVADTNAERDALPPDRSQAWRDLDVAVLHALVFDRLLGGVAPRFVHSATEAAEDLAARSGGVAFLLAPMDFDSVRAVAEAGDAMPQKSTYFIPKPKTGIVFRSLS